MGPGRAGTESVTAELRGLTTREARELLARNGPKVLPRGRRPPAVLLLLRQATHFFAVMLWVASGLALLGGLPELAAAIVVVVVVNAASRSCRSTGRTGPRNPSWT